MHTEHTHTHTLSGLYGALVLYYSRYNCSEALASLTEQWNAFPFVEKSPERKRWRNVMNDSSNMPLPYHLCLLYTRCCVHNTRGVYIGHLSTWSRPKNSRKFSGFMQRTKRKRYNQEGNNNNNYSGVKYLHICFQGSTTVAIFRFFYLFSPVV